MTDIASQFAQVSQTIEQHCQHAQRSIDDVQLLAVSKTRSAEQVAQLHHLGQVHFGENYLQEALDKQLALADENIIWHFIGPIQSNKTRPIAESFSWVHSVDRLKIAKRLAEQRPAELAPLNICLQVNISNEENKAGCSAQEVLPLINQLAEFKQLRVRGLMAIPKATDDPQEQQQAFAAMKQLLTQCQVAHPQLDTLSMGMSGDIGPAIDQGATIVRVGTALFGPRDYSNKA
jgi:pyridoxal phosphate enzyme (YggS family)